MRKNIQNATFRWEDNGNDDTFWDVEGQLGFISRLKVKQRIVTVTAASYITKSSRKSSQRDVANSWRGDFAPRRCSSPYCCQNDRVHSIIGIWTVRPILLVPISHRAIFIFLVHEKNHYEDRNFLRTMRSLRQCMTGYAPDQNLSSRIEYRNSLSGGPSASKSRV